MSGALQQCVRQNDEQYAHILDGVYDRAQWHATSVMLVVLLREIRRCELARRIFQVRTVQLAPQLIHGRAQH